MAKWIEVKIPKQKNDTSLNKSIVPTQLPKSPCCSPTHKHYGTWSVATFQKSRIELWIAKNNSNAIHPPFISSYIPPQFYKHELIKQSVIWFKLQNIEPEQFYEIIQSPKLQCLLCLVD